MFKNISIGKYIPGNSIVHSLNAKTKLLISFLFTILLFWTKNFIALLLIFAMFLSVIKISGISILKFIKNNIIVIIFAFFTTFINLIFEAESKFLTSGIFYVSLKSIKSSCTIFLRLLSLIASTSTVMFTTSASEISNSVEYMLNPLSFFGLNPRDIALTITITLRFIPTMIEEINKIIDAQKCRGVSFRNKNIFKNLKSIIAIFVPLFVSSINRAEDLAIALESRGYDSSKSHTKFKSDKLKNIDVYAILYAGIFIIGVILCTKFIKI